MLSVPKLVLASASPRRAEILRTVRWPFEILPVEIDESRRANLAAERRSKVTFEIEPIDGEQVKLTVIHDDLEPDGLLVDMISGGWPRVIANLKTLLETGEPLPDIRGAR